MKIETIQLSGVRNIRDISQYPTIDGRRIRKNVLIRSSKLSKASAKKRNKFLKEYNINTIIDLRTSVEVDEEKDLKYPENINYFHISVLKHTYFGITHEKKMRSALFKESKKFTDDASYYEYMINMYKSIVFEEYSQEKFKEFFNVLLEAQTGGILFHCAGGKDRTGIASLFILTILGVSKEDIIKDYSMSDMVNQKHNRWLSFWIRLLIPFKGFKKLLIEMLYAKKEYMVKTIEAIEQQYGSVLKYLEDVIGIDNEKQEKIKDLYLEKL